MDQVHFSPSLTHWLMQIVAMALTVFLLPGVQITKPSGLVLTVGAISAVNTLLWSDALFSALPDSLTQRAVLLVLTNGAIFWVLAKLLPGIEIHSVTAALFAPIVFSVLNVATHHYAPMVDWPAVAATTWEYLQQLFASLRSFFQETQAPK